MSNTSEFLKALNSQPERIKRPIVYRLYYKGTKILTMKSGPEDQDWPEGDWIEITPTEYNETRPNYHIIVDGKITTPAPSDPTWVKLEKSSDGPFTSLKNNIIFVAKKGENYKLKVYNGND